VRINFVHTPMSTVAVAERQLFWRNFDIQYHSTHPRLRHMRRNLWELPHWMLWLAGVLVSRGYTDLGVLDFYGKAEVFERSGALRAQIVRAAVAEHPADVYLFSPMTPNLHLAVDIAKVIRASHPAAVVIFGGVVATPLHMEVAANPNVDAVVVDRGEQALPALLDALRNGRDLASVPNVTRRDAGGAVVANPHRFSRLAAAEIPFPKVDLFPSEVGRDIRYLRQVYALGCPYRCTFCTIQTIGRRPDYFPITRVLAEIRAYRAHYGEHHHIYWGDETFTLYPQRTLDLLSALTAEGGITYDCQTRLNCLIDERLLPALMRSGCQWIEIGLETSSEVTLDIHKSHMKLASTEDTLRRLRDSGLAACAFMVNGFPGQTLSDMRRAIDWVCSLIDQDLLQASYLFGLVPYPGSAMYERPESFGMRLLHHDFSQYHEDLPPVFDTVHASPDQVYEVFLDGLGCLAQAMGKRPYFGGNSPSSDTLTEYGTFWAEAHV
jgi:anaerobic magnesium-protoporphyrin IX monomethyl ester cyclase